MWSLLLIALFTWLAVALENRAADLAELTNTWNQKRQALVTQRLGRGIEQWSQTSTVLPADFDTLVATEGFEHLRTSGNRDWSGYAVTNLINDGVWQFQRGIIFSLSPTFWSGASNGFDTDSFLADNQCGDTAFSDAVDWCAAPGARWHITDPRLQMTPWMVQQTHQLENLLDKWGRYYSANGEWPDDGGGTLSLASAVGVSASNNCRGEKSYEGIPLNCDEIFSVAGGYPVRYRQLSDSRIALQARLPLLKADGNPFYTTVFYDLPN
ncbi:hypothetical protein [Marinobacterium stanieri]|uniref:Type II secretory pathway, pseudopilin PulG n=1 Tax=Marinobacterium stanieri TaxID=49186 RepID=A0A1N6XH07_9GAMM|nr:hypothetical protein [Marinobacterium stanieri]SIR01666.1 hypothetical protein SAMN05421647_11426 [Marinobacterium stanieri]